MVVTRDTRGAKIQPDPGPKSTFPPSASLLVSLEGPPTGAHRGALDWRGLRSGRSSRFSSPSEELWPVGRSEPTRPLTRHPRGKLWPIPLLGEAGAGRLRNSLGRATAGQLHL